MGKKSSKILIIVSGGVVQSIYASEEDLKFEILDFDNEELKTKKEEEELLQIKSEGMNAIY